MVRLIELGLGVRVRDDFCDLEHGFRLWIIHVAYQ